MSVSAGGLAVQARIGVDKRRITDPALGRKDFCRASHAGHPIQLFIRASSDEEAQMNVRYRVELSQAERHELKALLNVYRTSRSTTLSFTK